jgi:hypothetical protein
LLWRYGDERLFGIEWNIQGPAEISVWSSRENPAAYRKGQRFTVTENSYPRLIVQIRIQFPGNVVSLGAFAKQCLQDVKVVVAFDARIKISGQRSA